MLLKEYMLLSVKFIGVILLGVSLCVKSDFHDILACTNSDFATLLSKYTNEHANGLKRHT